MTFSQIQPVKSTKIDIMSIKIEEFRNFIGTGLLIRHLYGDKDFQYRDTTMSMSPLLDIRGKNKPHVRPLSQMTEEIEIGGKKFVPIVELAKIAGAYSSESIIKVEYNIYDLMIGRSSVAELHFIVETTNMGSLHYQFSYCKEQQRFSLRDNTRKMPLSFINQIELFNYCYGLHLDMFGWIKKGLAIAK